MRTVEAFTGNPRDGIPVLLRSFLPVIDTELEECLTYPGLNNLKVHTYKQVRLYSWIS
jgi:hypothetical protein